LEDTLKEFMEITGHSIIQVPQPESSFEDALKEFMERTDQSTIQVPQPESSWEDTFKAFMHSNSQTIQELKNVTMVGSLAIQEIEYATMANTSAIERLGRQLYHLVAELNKMEEEELRGQLMAEGHYITDEDDSNNPHYEHVQATTTLGSEVVFETIVNEPNLNDPFEESCVQFEFDLDLVLEQDKALLDSTPEIRPENGETTEISFPNTYSSVAEEEEKGEHLEFVEHLEHTAPPSNPNLSNDKEISIEAHSFITIPLKTLHEPQASILQCVKEPSCAKTIKDLCPQGQKSRNRHPKKILQSKQVGYLRRRPILPEGYQILKKKGWKGLVRHPRDQGRRCKFSFPFYFPYI